MHIRTFEAPTLQEALAEIRRQMGADATVLHTRDVRKGLLGMLGKTRVEVTAGLKPKTIDQQLTPRRTAAATTAPANTNSADASTPRLHELQSQVTELDSLCRTLAKRVTDGQPAASHNTVNRTLNDLLSAGIDLQTATWIHALIEEQGRGEEFDSLAKAKQILRAKIRTAQPIHVPVNDQRVVALVGPTGVGKTTTIAKLAAGFRLQEKRSVGLITIDTFRMAGVDQLKKYADVMELPMEVVSSIHGMDDAMARLADADLILIDTVGRSPLDTPQIGNTQQMLEVAKPHEIHLVVSATSSIQTMKSIIDHFAVLKPTATILSKLDEVDHQPAILCFAGDSAPPLSYVTTGQNVPDDIDIPMPSELTQLAFGDTSGSKIQCDTQETIVQESGSTPHDNSNVEHRNLLAPKTA